MVLPVNHLVINNLLMFARVVSTGPSTNETAPDVASLVSFRFVGSNFLEFYGDVDAVWAAKIDGLTAAPPYLIKTVIWDWKTIRDFNASSADIVDKHGTFCASGDCSDESQHQQYVHLTRQEGFKPGGWYLVCLRARIIRRTASCVVVRICDCKCDPWVTAIVKFSVDPKTPNSSSRSHHVETTLTYSDEARPPLDRLSFELGMYSGPELPSTCAGHWKNWLLLPNKTGYGLICAPTDYASSTSKILNFTVDEEGQKPLFFGGLRFGVPDSLIYAIQDEIEERIDFKSYINGQFGLIEISAGETLQKVYEFGSPSLQIGDSGGDSAKTKSVCEYIRQNYDTSDGVSNKLNSGGTSGSVFGCNIILIIFVLFFTCVF